MVLETIWNICIAEPVVELSTLAMLVFRGVLDNPLYLLHPGTWLLLGAYGFLAYLWFQGLAALGEAASVWLRRLLRALSGRRGARELAP